MTLVNHQVVMDLHEEQQSTEYLYFEHKPEDEERTDGYYMTRQTWEDMHQPTSIVVSAQNLELEDDEKPFLQETYGEETLIKVRSALQEHLDLVMAESVTPDDIINVLQNAGILFRERA